MSLTLLTQNMAVQCHHVSRCKSPNIYIHVAVHPQAVGCVLMSTWPRIHMNGAEYPCVRGVFRIKCAGHNNFNTKDFRSSAISRLFNACLMPIQTYRSSGLYTAERRRQTRFYCWFGRPPPSSSWGHPGTAKGLPASTSPLWNRKRSAVAVFGKW